MHNAIMSELIKMKKSKIYYVCHFLVLLSAMWLIYKDLKINSVRPDDCENWMEGAVSVTTLFLSIASGFVLTFLIQREYADKTITNVLTAPTSRRTLFFSKLTVWFLWYVWTLILCILIYLIGGKMIFSDQFQAAQMQQLVMLFLRSRLMSFLAATPLLVVAFLQRATFYPTILCTLAFTGIEIFSLVMSVKFSCMIPWSAAMLCGLDIEKTYLIRAVISVLLTACLSIGFACRIFRKQNL